MSEPAPGSAAPRLDQLAVMDLFVPIRSSSGDSPDPARLGNDAFRRGTDEAGARFVAAFTTIGNLRDFGPPGSDHVRMAARDLFERAESTAEPVVVDPGAPSEVRVAPGVLGFLAAGIDPNIPAAMRARRPLGGLPELEAPGEVPADLARDLRTVLGALPKVERAWLLRAGTSWAAGIQMTPDALLGDFDDIRNRLHAVAAEHLGSARELAVTDLRAQALREAFDAIAAPFHVRAAPSRGLLGRLFGRSGEG